MKTIVTVKVKPPSNDTVSPTHLNLCLFSIYTPLKTILLLNFEVLKRIDVLHHEKDRHKDNSLADETAIQ